MQNALLLTLKWAWLLPEPLFSPMYRGTGDFCQNSGHHLALKGCETNNIQEVGLVWDASQSKHLQSLRTVRAIETSKERAKENKQRLCSTRGQPLGVFFPQRKLKTPRQELPMLPSLHGFFWERITYQILLIFLLNLFFTSRSQKSCCSYQSWWFQSNTENLFCWGSPFS